MEFIEVFKTHVYLVRSPTGRGRILRCLSTGISYSSVAMLINILHTFVLHCLDKVSHGVKEERKFYIK